jgi:hypothetical protein
LAEFIDFQISPLWKTSTPILQRFLIGMDFPYIPTSFLIFQQPNAFAFIQFPMRENDKLLEELAKQPVNDPLVSVNVS